MPNAGAPVYATDFSRWKCRAIQNTAQALAAATFTAITLDGADDVDDLGIHDPVTNNSRLTIGLALGWWLILGHFVSPNANASGTRARILKNGAAANSYASMPNINATSQAGFRTYDVSAMIQASVATDYVELHGYVDTAGSTTVSGDLRCSVSAVYLGL